MQAVAVKVIALDATQQQRADFDREVRILESCRDRNIVQFLGSCADGTQTLLVTEFMDEGAPPPPPPSPGAWYPTPCFPSFHCL